ncbi:hypothetical protein WA1_09180 [Scytonema hofmannii PCC 7110]|uniref:CopG family transcriptional regulator n=1 Tax=Scytonema hofmannii PCC 7110 TaxID=128403 RepID=A0A139WSA3_9CYAN|nr:hypothetical protein [Scytonema hofmannii]KYC35310.1 hypothetical protein WA1_09180 [Scytonema hofmannii PCC 7110]
MSKKEYDKKWQQANAPKVRAYTAKYQKGKRRATVILDEWIGQEIDKIKPPEQSLGGWIREKIERWAEKSRSETVESSDDLF